MGAEPQKPTGVRWLVFALAGLTSWLLYLHRYSWGVVKPSFKRENPHIDNAQLGELDSANMITYALGQVPMGLLGDRLGPRVILVLSILLWSLALAVLGLVHQYWLAFLTLGLFGLAQAGAYPVINKVTRTWFPLGYRTTIQGMVTALGRLGGAFAPFLIATVFLGEMELTWQNSLAIIAGPGILLALAVLVFLRNSPEQHPWTNEAERALLAQPGEGQASVRQSLIFNRSPATLLSFGMVLFYAFASTFADMLFLYWIPTFLQEEKGLDNTQTGLFTPLPLIGGAVGGILGGMLNDYLIRRLGNRRWGRSLVALTGKTMAAILIAVSVTVADGRVVMVILLACKFFGDWSLPTQWGTITDIAGRSAATVFGIVNTVGALGGMLGSFAMGRIIQFYGWNALFFLVACVYLAAALAWLIIDCRRTLVVQ